MHEIQISNPKANSVRLVLR